MALTGRPDGPPLTSPGDPAGQVRRSLARFGRLVAERTGAAPSLPDVALLGERAAVSGLRRNGPWSCGGAFRAVPTADGWIGLSLPRPTDLSLVPALVEAEGDADVWATVRAWATDRSTEVAVERARLLGLACTAIPLPGSAAPGRDPVVTARGGLRRSRRDRPLVVDLTSLWAGPLCAHLLGLGGADVVKVESVRRPDGARGGPPAFFDLLHAGHRMVALDLPTPEGRAALQALVERADLVLESSRPRALRQLGLEAEAVVDSGTSWLSITARGRDADMIGFGDDIAAGAGLQAWDRDEPLVCGDAIADPLTGVAAAEAAAEALLDDHARLVDVSMHDVTAAAADGAVEPHAVRWHDDTWWVECAAGEFPVAEPTARTPSGRAGDLGADTAEVLT